MPAALDRLNKAKSDALFIVDQAGELDGVVTREDLEQLANNGAGNIRKIVNANVPTTASFTPLNDLYGLGQQGTPIAVLNERGKLLGAVYPLDILAALAATEEVAAE